MLQVAWMLQSYWGRSVASISYIRFTKPGPPTLVDLDFVAKDYLLPCSRWQLSDTPRTGFVEGLSTCRMNHRTIWHHRRLWSPITSTLSHHLSFQLLFPLLFPGKLRKQLSNRILSRFAIVMLRESESILSVSSRNNKTTFLSNRKVKIEESI